LGTNPKDVEGIFFLSFGSPEAELSNRPYVNIPGVQQSKDALFKSDPSTWKS
jgi:hypothetical protein